MNVLIAETKKQNDNKNKKQAGGKVMKTTNNVQKAILKSLGVVFSLVLISFTVSAQDFWKALLENSSFNEIAIAMTEGTHEPYQASADASNATEANAFAVYLEEETEETLEMEDWMTNENYFVTNVYLEKETENPLELENWMTNEIFLNANSLLEEETEETLELEEWMVDENYFDVKVPKETKAKKTEAAAINNKRFGPRKFIFDQAEDQELQIEKWMVNNKFWEIG